MVNGGLIEQLSTLLTAWLNGATGEGADGTM
jgi:hypothetical protein